MQFYDYITDFIFVEDPPMKADVIFIPGGPYGEVAVHAADLYRQGFSALLIPSGKYSVLNPAFTGPISPGLYRGQAFETEADFLSAVLQDNGVPSDAILPERKATFTYENAIFTRELADQRGLTIRTALLSCQAYHARRCLLYYQALFPDARILVSPAETQGIRKSDWFRDSRSIDMVLSEVERCGSQFHDILKHYPYPIVPLRDQ